MQDNKSKASEAKKVGGFFDFSEAEKAAGFLGGFLAFAKSMEQPVRAALDSTINLEDLPAILNNFVFTATSQETVLNVLAGALIGSTLALITEIILDDDQDSNNQPLASSSFSQRK